MEELRMIQDETVFHFKISNINMPDDDGIVDIQIDLLDGPLNNISVNLYIEKKQGEWRKY